MSKPAASVVLERVGDVAVGSVDCEDTDDPMRDQEGQQPKDPRHASMKVTAAELRMSLQEQNGTRVCRLKDFLAIVLLFGLTGAAIAALQTQEQHLLIVANWIQGLELSGHLLFFLMFLFVGLPFGYNWSTTCILCGFAYGWMALIDAYLGTVISSLVSYYISRWWFRDCIASRIERLGPKKRLYLLGMKAVMESDRGGCLALSVLRGNPVLTFGMYNGFVGALVSVSQFRLVVTTILGMSYSTITCVYLGVLVKQLGSLQAATTSEQGRFNTIVNIVLYILFTVLGFVFLRYLTVRVLPRFIVDDAHKQVAREDLHTVAPKRHSLIHL